MFCFSDIWMNAGGSTKYSMSTRLPVSTSIEITNYNIYKISLKHSLVVRI